MPKEFDRNPFSEFLIRMPTLHLQSGIRMCKKSLASYLILTFKIRYYMIFRFSVCFHVLWKHIQFFTLCSHFSKFIYVILIWAANRFVWKNGLNKIDSKSAQDVVMRNTSELDLWVNRWESEVARIRGGSWPPLPLPTSSELNYVALIFLGRFGSCLHLC